MFDAIVRGNLLAYYSHSMRGRVLYPTLEDCTVGQKEVESFCVEDLYGQVDASSFALAFPGGSGLVAVYRDQHGRLYRHFSSCRLASVLSSLGIVAIVARGMAHKLSYLDIDGQTVELRHCENIRFSSPEHFASLVCDSPEDGWLAIGEAGERKSPLSICSLDNGLKVGRCGLASVMGAMNFKGIAVHCGSFVAPETRSGAKSSLMHSFSRYGNASLVDYGMENGWLAVKNWSGLFDPRCVHLDGRNEARLYKISHSGCDGCPASCIPSDGASGELLPSWLDCLSLGSNLGFFSLDKVARLKRKCDELGLDTVETGALLACLSAQSSLPYTYPQVKGASVDELERILSSIASRKGCGEIVSSGLDSIPGAIAMNGHSVVVDPRGAHAQALFSMLGENSFCLVDLVKNLKKYCDDEMVGRIAAWLRVFTHALENSGKSPVMMLYDHFDRKSFALMCNPVIMRLVMKAYSRKNPGSIRSGLSSIDSFDSLSGGMMELPAIFTMPSSVGYTDEVNVVKLVLGYKEELAYIRSLDGK